MTVDITVAPPFTDSTQRRQVAAYTGPTSYDPDTGDVLSPEDFRMGKIFAVLPAGPATDFSDVWFLHFGVNGDGNLTIFWLDADGGTPTLHANLSACHATIEVVGQ